MLISPPSSLRRLLSTLATLSFLLCVQSGAAHAADRRTWDQPFIHDSGMELISEAKRITSAEKGHVVILLDDRKISFDSEGRCTVKSRLVYRIMNQDGMKDWATMQTIWVPGYQDHPVFRARVITPDGVEHQLPQETIGDAPLGNSRNLFSDRKVVRAPLPAACVGAVVEREIVVREKALHFADGNDHRLTFPRGIKIDNIRLTVDYPEELPLRYEVRMLPKVKALTSDESDRKTLLFDFGPLGPIRQTEPGAPGDLQRTPEIALTTARSWSALASGYGRTFDRQLTGSDLSALVQEVVGTSAGRETIIRKLLARLQQDIRYTGIEFGTSSVIPHTPAETLERRYGDCKDQVALLVKMLRTAGVPAHAALLRAGDGRDVDPDFPAMSMFNHVIVYVPGNPALWIDPTDRFTPVGELPLPDQGRLALIADGSTTSLTSTPEAPSARNGYLEVREFHLAEQGAASVNVAATMSGSIAAGFRRVFDGKDKETLRKQMAKHIEQTYLSKNLASVELTNAKDLSLPLTMRLDVQDAKRGFTDGKNAVVAVSALSLTTHLPPLLTADDKGKPAARKSDYLLSLPHVYEMRYRIVPPPGFRAQALPKSEKSALGPMLLEREFRLEPDGVVTAVMRLDTVKRRFTAAEFQAAKEAVKKLRSEKPALIHFEQVAQSLLAAGKVREGLTELRRLSSLHPREALHHIQLAEALLQAGLSGAAKDEAERAVALEPESFLAHRTLGWVLQHDVVGRLRHKGYDRTAALREYRKAKELNQKDLATRADLAILLEFDEDGNRYSRHADLAGAIDEYKSIRSQLNSKNYNRNLLLCLLWSSQWTELKTLALSVEPSDDVNALLLTAVAAEEGVGAALEQAKARISDTAARRKAIEAAAYMLIKVRSYPEAVGLLEEASRGRENAASLRSKINILKKVRPFEKVLASDQGPTSVIRKMLLAVYAPEHAAEFAPDYLALFAPAIREEAALEGAGKEIIGDLGMLRAKARDAEELPKVVLADIILSTTEFRVVGGEDTGYRVEASLSRPSGMSRYRFFVIREKGEYYLLNAVSFGPVGLQVLRQVESGRLVSAKALLDWVREEITPARNDDPLAVNPLLLLWPKDSTMDEARMRLAAAALISDLPTKRAAPLLLKGRAAAKGDALTGIDIALMKAYQVGKRYQELLDLCKELEERHPFSGAIFASRTLSLRALHRYEEVKAEAQARLGKAPKDAAALRVIANCEAGQGDFTGSREWLKKMDEAGVAKAEDYNLLGWIGLFDPADPAAAISYAERAVSLTDGKESAVLHTLSALYAETGKPAEAREMILKSIAAADQQIPHAEHWYVLGRIAEEYGEVEAARTAYSKVTEPEADAGGAVSVSALVRKRMERGDRNAEAHL